MSAELGSDVYAYGGGKLAASKVAFTASVSANGDLRIRGAIVKGASLDGGKYTSAVSITGLSITNAPTTEIDRKDYTKALIVSAVALFACLAVFLLYRKKFPPPAGTSSQTWAAVLVVAAAIVGLIWVGIASLVFFANSWAADQGHVVDLFAKSVVGFPDGLGQLGAGQLRTAWCVTAATRDINGRLSIG